MDSNIHDVLKRLALAIKRAIDDGISAGALQPEAMIYQRWKVNKFQYTDKGITESSAQSEQHIKQTWFGASGKIEGSLKEFTEYAVALDLLTVNFNQRKNLDADLRSFARKVTFHYLSNRAAEEADIDAFVRIFLKNLREEPVKYGATVELTGVILQPESIDVCDGVTIRQPKISDLEKEAPEYSFMFEFLSNPSAILNIDFLGVQANEIQKRVEQAIAILRLFKTGSIKYLSYHMRSESITDTMASGKLGSGDRLAPLETYLVKNEDEIKLKNFWMKVSDSIPKSFYDLGISKIDHTTIAYNRYTDALLNNGILERRIANAIMGLEALFFKADGEAQELSYRLRMRVGKLLGLMGSNPHEVSDRVKDAYGIRSTFTHGGHLDYNKKRKLESKYGDPKNLLLSILDYLRISLIINLFASKEKDEFIDLIDDSLIDSKKEAQLTSAFSIAKDLIG